MALTESGGELAPTLSAVMPVFNDGTLLADSLGAVLAQSRPPDEIIVVNDGSTDSTREVLQRIASDHPVIRIIDLPSNVGVNRAANVGAKACTGKYLTFASADDLILPGFYESSMAMFRRYPAAKLCYGFLGVMGIDDTSTLPSILPRWSLPFRDFYSPETTTHILARRGFVIGGHTAIVCRTTFLQAGLFRPDLEWYADWIAFTTLAFRYGFCLIPKTVGLVQRSPDSYSASAAHPEQRKVLRHLLETLDLPAFDDVRRGFRQGGLNNGTWLMASVIASDPRFWKWLSLPYLNLRVRAAVGAVLGNRIASRLRHRWADRQPVDTGSPEICIEGGEIPSAQA